MKRISLDVEERLLLYDDDESCYQVLYIYDLDAIGFSGWLTVVNTISYDVFPTADVAIEFYGSREAIIAAYSEDKDEPGSEISEKWGLEKNSGRKTIPMPLRRQ